jgi:hypothetical protein
MRTFIAVGHLKARYPEEANLNNVALDIKTKLGELALQHGESLLPLSPPSRLTQ